MRSAPPKRSTNNNASKDNQGGIGLLIGLTGVTAIVLAVVISLIITILRARAAIEAGLPAPTGFFGIDGPLGSIAQQIVPDTAARSGAAPAAQTSQDALVAPPVTISPWTGTERQNILVLGIDQRPKEDPATNRTDTMILVTLDPIGNTAGMMSIPRDLYVPIPGKIQDRINAAHVYGGPKLSMQTVAYNFGVPVHHYVRVNFNVVVTIIDLVGGVEIYNDQDIADYQYPDMAFGYDPFFLKAGPQKLDGKTALKYMRTRHGGSDFIRIRRQQQVIFALRDKALSTDAITTFLPQAPKLYQALRDSIDTDLSLTELLRMLVFAKNLPAERIAKVSIDETATQAWTTSQGAQVLIPVRERIREIRDELYDPTKANAKVTPTPEPGKIILQNGTLTKGLAINTGSVLAGKGFVISRVENAVGNFPKTVIVDYHGRSSYSKSIALALGVPVSAIQTKLDAANPVDALVILGDDFQPK